MEDVVKRVRVNLKAAQDRQKSFADRRRRLKEYQVGDHVFVRIQVRKVPSNGASVRSWHPDIMDHFKSWQE